jgi:hypothetical protein
MRKNCQGTASRFLAEIYIGCMKVNRSPDVCRKLPLKRSAAATAIDLFASVTFAVAVIIMIAAACGADTILPRDDVSKSTFNGPKYAPSPLLSEGTEVA